MIMNLKFNSTLWFLRVLALAFTFAPFPVAWAANFTVSPATVSNTYSGYITMQVTGLTSGGTVLVQKYLDANTNGVIDASDMLSQQFPLTDGQAGMVIGGVTNINVPGDTDSTATQITARWNFQNGDISQNFIGKYAVKVSSPTGLFTPITNFFTVTNASYNQSFAGNVVNSGTNVPNAIVILFNPSGDGLNPQAGTVANNAGAYSIKAPPGTYQLLAFRSNYVANIATSPTLVLNSGATITTNLTLTNATQTISGKIVDAANSSLGLPGLLLPAQSVTSSLLTIAFTDTNGNFTLRVTPDLWKLEKNATAEAVYGYLVTQNSTKVDTSTGSVAGVTISCPKATALLFGTVTNTSNQPLVGVDLFANDNNGQYETETRTDQNGYYTLGALCGSPWQAQISNDGNPAFANYVFSQNTLNQNGGTNLTCGQVARLNFTALLATNHITGWVRDIGGSPVPNEQVNSFANIGGVDYQSQVNTDSNGNYSLNVANGNWSVNICCGCDDCGDGCLPSTYFCPDPQFPTIANNNAVANFTTYLLAQPVLSQPVRFAPTQVGFNLAGALGSNYTILTATNVGLPVANWSPFLVTNLTTSPAFILDTHATNKQFFYRALLGP